MLPRGTSPNSRTSDPSGAIASAVALILLVSNVIASAHRKNLTGLVTVSLLIPLLAASPAVFAVFTGNYQRG
jgi:hypothetical protein